MKSSGLLTAAPWAPPDYRKFSGSNVPAWGSEQVIWSPPWTVDQTIMCCSYSAVNSRLDGCEIHHRRARESDWKCFLFRKDELLDAECFFLKSVGLHSVLLQVWFHPGQILAWAGGWSPLIPTLLLWYATLSSLLFVPHGFECLSVITDSQKSPQVLLLTWHEILSAFF